MHSLIVANEEGRSKRTKRGKGFQRWVFNKKFLSFFDLCCNERSGVAWCGAWFRCIYGSI